MLKQAELGADIETTVPRPVEDGEPRATRTTVLRTQRIPVDPGDLRRRLDSLIRTERGELVRWLDKMLTTSQQDISFDELASALATGNVDGPYLVRWRERYSRYINDYVAPAWDAAQTAGSQVMIPAIEGFIDEAVEFALLGERMDAWTRERAATLVAGLTDNQRTALASMVRQFTTFDRRSPREVARFIRPLIGMTPRDSESLARQLKERLETSDENDSDIRRDLANQALTRIRRRAEMIAETELAYAYNFGTWHTVRDAEDEGAFGADIVVKRWWTQLDERVCPFCGPLHDTVIGMEETFPGKTPLVPNTFAPPAHPRCRCTLLYEVVDVDDDVALPAETAPPGAVPGPDGEPVVYGKPLTEAEYDAVMDDEKARLTLYLSDRGVDLSEVSRLKSDVAAKRQEFFDIPGVSMATPYSTPEAGRAFEAYGEALDAFDAQEQLLIKAFEDLLSSERDDPEYTRRKDTDSIGTVKQPSSGDHPFGHRLRGTYRRQAPTERRETNALQRETLAFFRRSIPPESVRDRMYLEIGAQRRRPRASHRTLIEKGWEEPDKSSTRTAISVGSSVKDGDGQRAVYHELGHMIEVVNGRVADASQILYLRRTGGERLKWLGPGYGAFEKTRKDKWFTAYVGKEYHAVKSDDTPTTRSSEVVSMSLEKFASSEALSDLAMVDLEHLVFAFAIQRGRFGWRP